MQPNRRELAASFLLLLGLVLITAGAFGFGWKLGCLLTGCACFSALSKLLNPPRL